MATGHTSREAPGHDSVQLVQITPITMVYDTYNELVTGAFVNQLTSLGGLTLYQVAFVSFTIWNCAVVQNRLEPH